MGFLRFSLMLIFLFFAVPRQSNASLVGFIQTTAHDFDKSKAPDQASQSPSPSPHSSMSSLNRVTPVSSPTRKMCDMVPYKCDITEYHISSCVPSLGNESQSGYVLIMNDGETSRLLNITVFPASQVVENVIISRHQSKKVKLPSNMGTGYSSILLNSEKENCTIHIGGSILVNFYTNYLTTVNGKYLLFVSALFIGGTLICYKLGRSGRHLNGFKYRELEMGQPESSSSFTIETTNDWNQEWDDEWDVEK